MKHLKLFAAVPVLFLLSFLLLAGCAADPEAAKDPGNGEPEETGTLVFTANGEAFVREGFLSKDGWSLTFDHAYITVSGVTAYQTEPPYDTEQGWDIDYQVKVELPGVYTVDLANPDADPAILKEEAAAPAGRYHALSWEMAQASEGPAKGYMLYLVGKAEKGSEVIQFVLRLEKEVAYIGGEYIGDERKGILAAGDSAEMEMTFHFDHLFGDGAADENDSLNREALGFDPLAALAVDGLVDVSLAELQDDLSAADYQLLVSILTHLAHVGEGHCLAKFLE
ncbi:MAG: DUF4382 domain-containing protein [Bacillota bacterium]